MYATIAFRGGSKVKIDTEGALVQTVSILDFMKVNLNVFSRNVFECNFLDYRYSETCLDVTLIGLSDKNDLRRTRGSQAFNSYGREERISIPHYQYF